MSSKNKALGVIWDAAAFQKATADEYTEVYGAQWNSSLGAQRALVMAGAITRPLSMIFQVILERSQLTGSSQMLSQSSRRVRKKTLVIMSHFSAW